MICGMGFPTHVTCHVTSALEAVAVWIFGSDEVISMYVGLSPIEDQQSYIFTESLNIFEDILITSHCYLHCSKFCCFTVFLGHSASIRSTVYRFIQIIHDKLSFIEPICGFDWRNSHTTFLKFQCL